MLFEALKIGGNRRIMLYTLSLKGLPGTRGRGGGSSIIFFEARVAKWKE